MSDSRCTNLKFDMYVCRTPAQRGQTANNERGITLDGCPHRLATKRPILESQ